MADSQLFRQKLYPFIALLLMGCGGYFLYEDKTEAGLAIFGAGASMMALQQSEDNKVKKIFTSESVDKEAANRRIEELQINNDYYKSTIELKDTEIVRLKEEVAELKIQKAVLETDLKYANDPYYIKAKLDRFALPQSSLEEFDNSSDRTDEAAYNEIEIEEEDNEQP
ncbi:MAG: hypothetical protein AAFR77_19275 [Cyanobacteria bacterium J06631_2]